MALKDLKFIDPLTIKDDECPLFVQSGDMRGLIGFGIKERTNSNWSHSMVMRKAGHFCSQNFLYKEIPFDSYMKPGMVLKFWRCVDITPTERLLLNLRINRDLAKPWHKRLYDFFGVVGHFFGLRWFNIPWLNYCSERVRDSVALLIPSVGKHPTPEDIDKLFEGSERMEVVGYWFDL